MYSLMLMMMCQFLFQLNFLNSGFLDLLFPCCQGYLQEVELSKERCEEEAAASEWRRSGDAKAQGIVDLLQKLRKADQIAVYYTGGLQILHANLTDSRLL